MDHLPGGMHSSVGTPRTVHCHLVISHPGERLLEQLLDTPYVSLVLPTVKGTAIVFHTQRYFHLFSK
jgi:hypothetical protein